MDNKTKKIHYSLLLLVVVFSLLSIKLPNRYNHNFGSFLSLSNIASAEDDDEDDDEDEDDDFVESAPTIKTQPQTYEQIIRLPDQIITKTIMENVVLVDTDKDGLADVSDPHPTIPEYIIVQDSDNDGIADSYDLEVVNDQNNNGVDDKYEK